MNITAVDVKASPDEVKKIFTSCGDSRIPVYENTIDTIVGVVHEKDFFLTYFGQKHDLRAILNAPVYTTEHIKISSLLKQLQKRKTHMAVVLDEYGGTAGIVTLEDILEELVGEIWDEHDEVVQEIVQISEREYKFSGRASVKKLFDLMDEEDESEAATVGGWVMEQLKKIPAVGDNFDYKGTHVEVTEMEEKRVLSVHVILPEEEKTE